MHHTAIEQNQLQAETPKRYQCRHIFTDGHRCGSPCLRGEDLCYYHHTTRKPATDPRTPRSRRSTFEIPLPEDRSAIQHSIGQVLQRIAANDIDPRRAGLLLYGLQIASLNLPRPAVHRNAKPDAVEIVEETTTHPELGTLAPPAEVGKSTERKSRVALLLEKILEGDKQNQQEKPAQPEPATIPTLQATEDDPAQNPCNCPNPVVALFPACRAATHLRSLPSAIGATQRPAESSHASLKTPKQLQSLRTSRAAAQKGCGSFIFHAPSARRGHDVHRVRSANSNPFRSPKPNPDREHAQ